MTTHLIAIKDSFLSYPPWAWGTASVVETVGPDPYPSGQVPISNGAFRTGPTAGYPSTGSSTPGYYDGQESWIHSDALLASDGYGIFVGKTTVDSSNDFTDTPHGDYHFGVKCIVNTEAGRNDLNDLAFFWSILEPHTGVSGNAYWPGAVPLPEEVDTPTSGELAKLTVVHAWHGGVAGDGWDQADPTATYELQWSSPWIDFDNDGKYTIDANALQAAGHLTYVLNGSVNSNVSGIDHSLTVAFVEDSGSGMTNPWFLSLLDEAFLDFSTTHPPASPFVPQSSMAGGRRDFGVIFE